MTLQRRSFLAGILAGTAFSAVLTWAFPSRDVMKTYPAVEALNVMERYYRETRQHPTLLRCGPRAYRELVGAHDCVLGEDGQWRLCGARVIVDESVFDFKADMEPVVK